MKNLKKFWNWLCKQLKRFWNWLLGKTTIDEKIEDVVDEIKERASRIKEEFDVEKNDVKGKVSDAIDLDISKTEEDLTQKPYTHPDKFEIPDDVNEDWEPPNKGKKADPKAFLKQAETKKNYTTFKNTDKE